MLPFTFCRAVRVDCPASLYMDSFVSKSAVFRFIWGTKHISIRKRPRWSKPLIRPISCSMMKFWFCQKNNPHKPEKPSTHERAISHVWRFSFLFCRCHSAQNSRIKFYTQKSAKIGFPRPFCRFSPNFATDLLQSCYKRLKRGPPTIRTRCSRTVQQP